ncbi:putative sterol-sensing domain of SREBP cleavage-activation protein [Elsinoe fawcettii]|nr:putative sterol-sensing domain of SREBP cleavage-activation protein [Elsinoe fawcettii]
MHLIWYLLYPFRGTLDPPEFRHENPIRRAFYRHGALTARYWLPAMLASVTIGVILSYPTVFMSDFPSGATNGLPHHVWTGSISFESRTEKQPDLEMRQVWLQGDYMQALNKSLIRQAFNLETLLLQDDVENSPSSAWGIQSPSVYWNHSPDLFEADVDPIKTLSTHKQDLSLLGFQLQPLSAFAGKNFHAGKLTAADALIITLVNRQNASIGDTWQRNIAELATNTPSQWSIGKITGHSSIYEYKFQPFSIRQYWALIGAYFCMFLYVVVSLRRLKAFRSRSGLVVTAITQMTTSILASFTICGLLRINLDQIPQEAYPFVVLAIGLENIFRLINAVLAYPAEMATVQRIANGVADIGGSSLVAAVQNLALLWTLSLFVSPGVAAFCAFASIALLFDFFFLITFFLAVLNVDIKRLELQDSLTRSKSGAGTSTTPRPPRLAKSTGRQSWVDALFRGRLPVSTRMAGSIITVTFVMALNWHFSDHTMSALRTSPWSSPVGKKYLPSFGSEEATAATDTAIDTSNSWMGSKSSTTDAAAQFMHVIKPGVRSFTARIYDPLVVVSNRADRTSIPNLQDSFLHALRDLAIRHFYPFALAVVFMIAFTTVLMNFLLWDERIETPEIETMGADEGPLSHSTIETNHSLDIVRLASSRNGKVLTVGLDKTLAVAIKDRTTQKYGRTTIGDQRTINSSWPIDICIADSGSDEFALMYRNGNIQFGKTTDKGLSEPITIDVNQPTQRLLVCEFIGALDDTARAVMIVLNDGVVHEISRERTSSTQTVLSCEEGRFASAIMVKNESGTSFLLVLTELGSVFSYSRDTISGQWTSVAVSSSAGRPNIAAPAVHEAWLYAISSSHLVLLCTPDEAVVIDATTLQSCATITLSNAVRNSVRTMSTGFSRCSTCEGHATSHLSLAYKDAGTSEMRLLSYTRQVEHWGSEDKPSSDLICISANSDCATLTSLSPSEFYLQYVGAWETTNNFCVAGVRRRPYCLADMSLSRSAITSATKTRPPAVTGESPLRRRRRISASEYMSERGEEWEAYIFTHQGNLFTAPIKELSGDTDSTLWADIPGPVAQLSDNSVGVAIGNSVIVVKANENPDLVGGVTGRERRQSGGLDRLTDGGRESFGLGTGSIGVRRSASRSKRGGVLGMTKGRRKE